MIKHSVYIFTFLSISFGANLCADLEEEKRTEETIQDKKRVDQSVEDKKVEQDLEQRKRIDDAIDRKRFEQQEQEKRRDRSDNASKSKNQIADKDDEQKKGNERDALKQPEEKGPLQEREQQKREEQQKKDEQKFEQQKREGRPKNDEQQFEQQRKEVKQKNDEQHGERPNLKPLVPQPITKERFDKDSANWNLKGKKERDEFRKNRTQTHVFDKDYWDRYNKRTNKWHFKDNMNWWAPVAVPAIDNWLHIRGGRQRYYYYGDNGVIYYSDNNSYNSFIAVPGYNDFVYQGVVLARNIPKINYQDIQWMPVGVFTLTQTNESNRSPNDYFTLAISPEGIVGGVYFNPQTNQNEEIEGMVDSQSFRVVWKFMSSDWPVFETGLFNLTQDESTAFIHYSEGRTDSQLLIRLQQ